MRHALIPDNKPVHDLPNQEGWKAELTLGNAPARVELAISRSQVRRPNTTPPSRPQLPAYGRLGHPRDLCEGVKYPTPLVDFLRT